MIISIYCSSTFHIPDHLSIGGPVDLIHPFSLICSADIRSTDPTGSGLIISHTTETKRKTHSAENNRKKEHGFERWWSNLLLPFRHQMDPLQTRLLVIVSRIYDIDSTDSDQLLFLAWNNHPVCLLSSFVAPFLLNHCCDTFPFKKKKLGPVRMLISLKS